MLTLICLGIVIFTVYNIFFFVIMKTFLVKKLVLIISLIKNGNSLHFKNLYKTKEKKTFNMIIDCFPFLMNCDLLEIRLNY